MKLERNRRGGLNLELSEEEAALFQHVVERAAFIDTPPDRQNAILRLAEEILAGIQAADPAGHR